MVHTNVSQQVEPRSALRNEHLESKNTYNSGKTNKVEAQHFCSSQEVNSARRYIYSSILLQLSTSTPAITSLDLDVPQT